MTKTLIDIDDALLSRARTILGTRTKKDTVDRALQDVIDRAERAEGLRWLHDTDALAALRDPELRSRARR